MFLEIKNRPAWKKQSACSLSYVNALSCASSIAFTHHNPLSYLQDFDIKSVKDPVTSTFCEPIRLLLLAETRKESMATLVDATCDELYMKINNRAAGKVLRATSVRVSAGLFPRHPSSFKSQVFRKLFYRLYA